MEHSIIPPRDHEIMFTSFQYRNVAFCCHGN